MPIGFARFAVVLVVALGLSAGCRIEERGPGESGATRSGASTTSTGPTSTASSSTTALLSTTTIPRPTTAGTPGKIVLQGNGYGIEAFGGDAETTISRVAAVLGPPDVDRLAPGSDCPGIDRLTTWGRFSLTVQAGRSVGWAYFDPDGKHMTPPLSTSSGVTIGTTVAVLRRQFGAKLTLSRGGLGGPSFSIDLGSGGRIDGRVTKTSDTGIVAGMRAGTTCGTG